MNTPQPPAKSFDLKPCPFCGGNVHFAYQGSSDWTFDCQDCQASIGFWVNAHVHGYGEGEQREVTRRWNTRVQTDERGDSTKKQDNSKSKSFEEWFLARVANAAHIYSKIAPENQELLKSTMKLSWTAAQSSQSERVRVAVEALEKIVNIDCRCGNDYQLGNCGCRNRAEFIAEDVLDQLKGGV